MLIRDFRIGDEPVLASVMFSSVHELARNDYSPAQLEAWARQSNTMRTSGRRECGRFTHSWPK
jgi:hypothetical protein